MPGSDDLDLFWAKSVDDGAGSLPVTQHADDVASIITVVAQRMVAPGQLRRLQSNLGGVELSKVLRFAAASHDVGKVSAYFQPKVDGLYSRVRRAGYTAELISPEDLRKVPHSLVSARAAKSWFSSRATTSSRKSLRGWQNVLGGHHGAFPSTSPPTLDSEDSNWSEARMRFLDRAAAQLGLSQEDIDALATLPWTAADQVLITGILIAADWVGSNEKYFPYNDYELGLPANERLERALDALDLGGTWHPQQTSELTFAERFGLPEGSARRSVQQAGYQTARAQSEPSLFLIENETGGGKTETAFEMAEVLAQKLDLNGVFIAQPTRMTSDAMFDRTATWLEHTTDAGSPLSTILAHGKAQANDHYRAIMPEGRLSAIYDESAQGGLEATQWFRGRKTGLLASVVVGTIDQLLYASLQSKHAMLRHLGLASKVVILDEVHAADAFMRTFLDNALEWLAAYGVPVIALSATLPPAQREELVDAYLRGAATANPEQAEGGSPGTSPEITDAVPGRRATRLPAHHRRRQRRGTHLSPRTGRPEAQHCRGVP